MGATTTIHVLYRQRAIQGLLRSDAGYKHVASVFSTDADEACTCVDDVWRMMNTVDGSAIEIPRQIRNRSMMVGDIAIVEQSGTRRVFECAACGWEELSDARARSMIARISLIAPHFDVHGVEETAGARLSRMIDANLAERGQ